MSLPPAVYPRGQQVQRREGIGRTLTFLLITDGITWRGRTSDLGKLVTLQNQGKIARIYTQSMAKQLEADLKQLKKEHGL